MRHQQQHDRRDFLIGASSDELGTLDGGGSHQGSTGGIGSGSHRCGASRYVAGGADAAAAAAAADFQPPYFPPPYSGVPQPPGPGPAALGVDFAAASNPHHHHHALAAAAGAHGSNPYSRLAAAAGSHYAATPYHHHQAQCQQYVADRHQLFAGIDPQSSLQRGFVATGIPLTVCEKPL